MEKRHLCAIRHLRASTCLTIIANYCYIESVNRTADKKKKNCQHPIYSYKRNKICFSFPTENLVSISNGKM